MGKVEKAYEITDAKISFVSLVDKAANKKQFLITKAEKGEVNFTTFGRILKVDNENHYITGIVYEPMVEDSHGNFMTEEEITKAAYWFAKNGDKVDIQHSFEELSNATVVENWVTKSDENIEGQEIKKGTWLLTVEISDPEIWDKVQKGEITGFSMGGVGKYSDENVDLNSIQKKSGEKGDDDAMNTDTEKKGLFKKLAEALGFDVVEKGAMKDKYNASIKSTRFWTAFYTLEDLLYKYNWNTDRWEYETDEAAIKSALEEFSEIIMDVLTEQSVVKALLTDKPIRKAGKKMSASNKAKLNEIVQSLSEFASQFDEDEGDEQINKNSEGEKEDDIVKAEDIRTMIQEEIKKAMESGTEKKIEKSAASTAKDETKDEVITKGDIQEVIAAEIKKALGDEEEEAVAKEEEKLTKDDITEIVRKELSAVLKAKGIATNLNGEPSQVKKSESHYLTGIL